MPRRECIMHFTYCFTHFGTATVPWRRPSPWFTEGLRGICVKQSASFPSHWSYRFERRSCGIHLPDSAGPLECGVVFQPTSWLAYISRFMQPVSRWETHCHSKEGKNHPLWPPTHRLMRGCSAIRRATQLRSAMEIFPNKKRNEINKLNNVVYTIYIKHVMPQRTGSTLRTTVEDELLDSAKVMLRPCETTLHAN